jgi:hypothetical protein
VKRRWQILLFGKAASLRSMGIALRCGF